MFDDSAVWVHPVPSVLERALCGLLGQPAPTFVLADGYRSHGRHSRRPDTEPTGTPGVEVSGELSRLLEAGADHLRAAREAFVAQTSLAAAQARALTAFAAHRPAVVLDRPDGDVGAAAVASRAARPAALSAVSEWAVDEVMAALSLPSSTAVQLLSESMTLVERLPGTLAALEAGTISWAHARALVDRLGSLPDEVRRDVEASLLARAAGKTVPQLREAARRAVLRADASAAAQRMAQAVRDRSVRCYADEDGMGSLTATMSMPVMRACYRALEAYADACAVPGDERTKDQRMADCLTDLILRPGATDRPPVQVLLTVVAPAGTLTGGSQPGEIDGHPVPAVLVREMAHALGLLPRPAPATSRPDDAPDDATTSRPDEGPDEAAPGSGSADDAARAGTSPPHGGTPGSATPAVSLPHSAAGRPPGSDEFEDDGGRGRSPARQAPCRREPAVPGVAARRGHGG